MRLFALLALTGFLALLSLPGAAMAHGVAGDAPMAAHMADCPECPEYGEAAAQNGGGAHECPHVTGCAALVLIDAVALPPVFDPERARLDLPPPDILSGADSLIDLPPPRRMT